MGLIYPSPSHSEAPQRLKLSLVSISLVSKARLYQSWERMERGKLNCFRFWLVVASQMKEAGSSNLSHKEKLDALITVLSFRQKVTVSLPVKYTN